MNTSVIIIGGGAAGLMAAKILSQQGHAVTMLEASGRIGGRIHTMHGNGFTQPIELGAEFVHGNLPITLGLLKEAKIPYVPAGGKMVTLNKGKIEHSSAWNNWDEMIDTMQQLQEDITVASFLQTYFSEDKYAALRNAVKGFAEGYDLADISTASVFALRDEWTKEEEPQYRIPTGYSSLLYNLLQSSLANGTVIHYNSFVERINCRDHSVEVITIDGKTFSADCVVVTVSLGMLLSGKIRINPAIPQHIEAAANIGFGTATKIFLQFNNAFWNSYASNAGFIMGNEEINVWWTQSPDNYSMLTGWLGGSKAQEFAAYDEQKILSIALENLSAMFNIERNELQRSLTAFHVADWSRDSFALGGYSYDTLHSAAAKKIMNTGIEQKIFFAGEAYYHGDAPGTVEAAFESGSNAATHIINMFA